MFNNTFITNDFASTIYSFSIQFIRSNLTKSTESSHQHVKGFIDIPQKLVNTLRVDFSGGPVGEEEVLQGLETVVIDNYVLDFKERNQILSHPAC